MCSTVIPTERVVLASSLILSYTAVTPSQDYPHFMNKEAKIREINLAS